MEANAKFASLLQDISKKAEREDIEQAIAELIGSAPEALDTLYELAEALGNDPEFATTVMTMINGKVDKIDGKGLSTEDYTTEEKQKLASIEAGANKYVHPSTHPASMITESPQRRFVSDEEKARWNAKWDYNEETIRNVKVYHAVNADTVNGKTVESNVPADAKFTDTTYSEITEAEIDAGTSSTLRTISGRRVKYILDKVKGWINSLTKADIGLENVDNVKQASKAEFDSHQNNTSIHITEIERQNWNAKAEVDQIPTKVSQLENDKNYVTVDELGRAGYGDMHKSIYDKNDDGVVDKADEASFQIVLDAREEDRPPIFYLTNGQKIMWELKYRTAVGNPPAEASANSTYAFVATISGWNDGSGGYPVQVSFGKKIAVRQGVSNESWSNWQVMASAEDIPSKLSQLEKDIHFDERYYTENEVDTMLAGKADIVHAHTKSQVGLTNVEDYGVASQAEAEAGAVNNKYMTPLRVKQAIASLSPVKSVNGKTGHVELSKSDVGLGSVEDYGIASTEEAIAGTSNEKYMTPARTKDAIDHFAPVKSVNDKIGDVVLSKSDVGLGNVQNYGMATQAEAEAGTATNKYMNPARTKDAILALSPVKSVNGKTGNVALSKSDVGLGNVQNYGVATQAEAEAGTASNKYMTPERTSQAINALQAVKSVNNKTGAVTITKSDIGLGNVENYGVATQSEAEVGASNSKYMTPIRTKQAIESLSPVKSVNGKTGDVTVTKADIGLGNVLNERQATKTELDALKNSLESADSNLEASINRLQSKIDSNVYPPNNTARSNLGNPSLFEAAIIESQATNKLWFYPADKILIEQSDDGVVFTERTDISLAQKKKLVSGNNNADISFPKGKYLRITISAKGYVYLNWLYLYISTLGDRASFKIEKKRDDEENWVTVCDYTNSINGWPAHVFIPHANIPFSPNSTSGHYNHVRITIKAAEQTNSYDYMKLYGLEWWGGYPQGRRTIYSHDENQNVTFPANVIASTFKNASGKEVLYQGDIPTKLSSFTKDINFDERYYTKSEVDQKLSGKSDIGHTHTKSEVGLSNVQNYGIATQSEAEAGTATNKYMTPERTKQAILALQSVKSVNSRTGDVVITKSDVGLGSVQNYGLATQAQAEAGSVDTAYMTPLKTKYAINALSPVKSVAGKTGAVTLSSSDVGLGNVQNYGVATQSEAEAGTANNKYMTPLTTKQAINALSPVKSVNGKTGAVSITKSDVSLGNVQNYGIATQAEAEAGVSDAKYMTPLKTKQAIVKTISEYKYGGRYQWVYNENTDSLELIYTFDSLELI